MADAVEAPIKQSLVAEIVGSYVKKNQIAPADLPTLIAIVHRSLLSLGKPAPPEEVPRTPAISVRRSVTPNNVTCIECGWRGLMLRRHLRVSHGLSAQEYRTRWRLNPDHAETVFRVRMEDLKPGITYYYTVDSMGGDGTRDGMESTVYQFKTPANLPEP